MQPSHSTQDLRVPLLEIPTWAGKGWNWTILKLLKPIRAKARPNLSTFLEEWELDNRDQFLIRLTQLIRSIMKWKIDHRLQTTRTSQECPWLRRSFTRVNKVKDPSVADSKGVELTRGCRVQLLGDKIPHNLSRNLSLLNLTQEVAFGRWSLIKLQLRSMQKVIKLRECNSRNQLIKGANLNIPNLNFTLSLSSGQMTTKSKTYRGS